MKIINQLLVRCSVLLTMRLIGQAKEANEDNTDDFNRLIQEQLSICSTHFSCLDNQNFTDSFGSPCCGSCTCRSGCSKYGSCCLSGYKSLTDARRAVENTRYGCVSAQFYSADNTKPITDAAFWMISKCDPSYPDNSNKKLCEIPQREQSIESFIPVTEMSRTMITYRNIYCAFCNNMASTVHLIRWSSMIYYDNNRNTSTLNFDKLKRDGAYIIFEKPDYLNVDECLLNWPSYYVSSCNETGLWRIYNRRIEQACNAYRDPFNDTFKNYFCYLCNRAEHQPIDQWKCKQPPAPVVHKPQFTVTLDTRLLVDDHKRPWLLCDKKQIPDKQMMVCRNVRCHSDLVLKTGSCMNFDSVRHTSENELCFSAFLKATPSSKTRNFLEELIPIQHSIFNAAQLSSHMWSANINFYQTDFDENIEHVISYILVKFHKNISRLLYDDFFENLLSLKNHNVSIIDSVNTQDNNRLLIDMKQYNITFSDGKATIKVPNQADASFDELTVSYWPPYYNDCLEQEVLLIKKVYICPFLELHIDEYPTRIENTFLYFDMNRTSKESFKVLESWQFEIYGDQIYICLEDFLDVYEAIVKWNSKLHSSTVTMLHSSQNLFLMFTIFLYTTMQLAI